MLLILSEEVLPINLFWWCKVHTQPLDFNAKMSESVPDLHIYNLPNQQNKDETVEASIMLLTCLADIFNAPRCIQLCKYYDCMKNSNYQVLGPDAHIQSHPRFGITTFVRVSFPKVKYPPTRSSQALSVCLQGRQGNQPPKPGLLHSGTYVLEPAASGAMPGLSLPTFKNLLKQENCHLWFAVHIQTKLTVLWCVWFRASRSGRKAPAWVRDTKLTVNL